MSIQRIVSFLTELGQLKRIKHEGWRLAGVGNPDSIADHSLRVAQIAYILAGLEEYENPYEVCTMAVFHDIGETRIGDIHKLASRYVNVAEELAVHEQLAGIACGEEILSLWKQVDDVSSPAGVIAKDADMLEQALTAKEYVEQGYADAQEWIDSIERSLRTQSAQALLHSIKGTRSTEWWKGLKSYNRDD